MRPLNFTPFPTLTTERLTLRRVVATDVPALFQLRSNPALMRYVPRPLARTPEDAAAVLAMIDAGLEANERINWGITLTSAPDELLGVIGYVRFLPESHRAEVGYMLRAEQHGQGLTREALTAVVDYGFRTLGLHSVEAVIHPDNVASRRLAERCGFVQEAHFRDYQFFEGAYRDSVVYSLVMRMRNEE